jgi:hypothetical protein
MISRARHYRQCSNRRDMNVNSVVQIVHCLPSSETFLSGASDETETNSRFE